MQAKIGVMEKQMCQGLMRATAALKLSGALPPRPAPFNSDEQYFEQRFFFMSTLSAPAPLTYPDYATAMNLSGTRTSIAKRRVSISAGISGLGVAFNAVS